MKRVASRQAVLEAAKNKRIESTDGKKKTPIDWAQKRASKLILAPQGRLTEFKAYVQEGGEEEQIQNWATSDPVEQPQISLASLSDLLPICIARDLSERPLEVAMTPSSQQIQAACLFLDISQFTAISEFLSSEGMRGPERLAQHINQLFTQLLRVVGKAGGDIFKFAGDAVIVLWPVDKDSGEDLQQVARRAVQCACDVQETLPKMEIPGEKKFSLAFKCGVGVGNVCIVHLGGGKLLGLPATAPDDTNGDAGARSSRRVLDPRTHSAAISSGEVVVARREYVAVGDPLKQAFSAEKLASRNDIIVSRQTWSLVSEHFTSKLPKNGKPLPEGFQLIDEKGKKDLIKKKKPKVTVPPQKEWMLTYVPRSAHLFLEVEHHTRKDWVSELRRVTVLFINMGVPKQELATILTKHEGVDRLHEYFCAVQRAVLDYEGSINKFLMDDKGSTVIAVFGLPPISHENDATRGVLASLAISVFLQEMGAEPAVGVATGIAFCGVVGHPGGRREYTVLGDIVNLSARLMQRASEKQEGVLTDSETYYQAQEQLEFNYLKQVQVKGKAKKVDVWQPHARGFKTKRTLIGKALGQKKHRRRPSLDADWKDQVSHVTDKSRRDVLGQKEAQVLKQRMEEAALIEQEPPRQATQHHEDERDLPSDSFDEMIAVMSRMYRAVLGRLPVRDRLESKDSTDGMGYNEETKRSERRPRSIVLEGSIGTGKSRLLSRLSDVLSMDTSLWVLEATCNPFERGALARPFGVFVTLISIALLRVYNDTKKDGGEVVTTLDDVPITQRRAILLRWLALGAKTDSNYLLNEDFGVDFEEPADVEVATSADSAENRALISKKAQIIQAIFDGLAQGRRIVLVIDDAVHLDQSSWQVALALAANGPKLGEGVCLILASRPVADFVLIDANSRGAYAQFRLLPGVLRETVPLLPPRSVRRLACDQLKVKAIGPEIEMALDKCQGNPLFVRELIQSMLDTPDVLDLDVKNNVATFGKAAACKLHDKALFPICERCNTRLTTKRAKVHCFACGRVLCAKCAPESNKRFAVGYKEAVRTCLDCSEDVERHRRVTADAITAMNLDPPVAIVCVIGTWIDKLTIPQQMVLKVACLLQRDMRFEKTQAFEAYPLDAGAASFELEFDALVQLGFVRQVNTNWDATAEEEDVYEFCHNFLPDVLNQRVLSTQRDELENHINDARLRREEQDRERFMKNKGNNLASLVLKEGYLMVLKRSVGSNRMAWKQRWGVVVGHRLEFYHERGSKTFASACDLRSAKVSIERGQFAGRFRVIRVQVPGWEKGGKILPEKRDFFISPELCTDPERDQWMYFLRLAIEANTEGGAKTTTMGRTRKSMPSSTPVGAGGWFNGNKKKSDASQLSRKSETDGQPIAKISSASGSEQARPSSLQAFSSLFSRKSNMNNIKDLQEKPGDEEQDDDGSFEIAGPGENSGNSGGVLGSLFGRKSNLREQELLAQVAAADAAAEDVEE